MSNRILNIDIDITADAKANVGFSTNGSRLTIDELRSVVDILCKIRNVVEDFEREVGPAPPTDDRKSPFDPNHFQKTPGAPDPMPKVQVKNDQGN